MINDHKEATSLINETDVEMSTGSESTNSNQQSKNIESSSNNAPQVHQIDDSSTSNQCLICLTEEKQVACIPCGHLCACVACGHSLRSCPICRHQIEALVRVYV